MSAKKNYTYRCRVEFEDIDSYGIAHHSRLINMLERARVNFFHSQGVSVSDGNFNLVLVNLNINFKSPAHMMDELDVVLTLERLSNFSLTFGYQILNSERLVLEGNIKMASVNKETKPATFPENIRQVLESLKSDS